MTNTLFISFSKRAPDRLYLDASVRYRCVFPAEKLNSENSCAHVIHITQLNKVKLNDYETVICHRPQYGKPLKKIVNQQGKFDFKLISDWDDLLFNPELANESPAYLSGQLTLQLSRKYSKKYEKALKLFNTAWLSTTALEKQLLKVHSNCITQVRFNKVTERWAKQSPINIEERLANKVIRYFPGTSHHLSNFKQVSNFLSSYLQKNPDITLEVVGNLNFDISQFPEDQIRKSPFFIFEDLPTIIKNSWVTISPLEDNLFNECKSGLKVWESGLFSVPVISSPNPDMQRFHNKGLLLSQDFNEWEEYLDKLKDESFYREAASSNLEASLNAVSKSHISNNEIELMLCAAIGADWPLVLLNPAHPKHKKAQQFFPADDYHRIVKPKEGLIDLSNRNKAQYLSQKPKKYRKLKKLVNNPRLFIRDMIKKKFKIR